MVATIKENDFGKFYCSVCRISISKILDICPFCGAIFSNYEEMIIKNKYDQLALTSAYYEEQED